jgi:S1-C subfamily serine protease
MKKKIILLLVLSMLLNNVVYATVRLGETGQEIQLTKTTDGWADYGDEVNDGINKLKNNTVIVYLESKGVYYRGAGIAISKRHIVTVNHVTYDGGKNFYQPYEDSPSYWATVIKQDPTHDIAILEIDKGAPDLPFTPIAFAKEIKMDESVYTIGHPLDNLYALTQGTVGWLEEKGWNDIKSVQLNIRAHEGNSGGFVINNSGEIVGMVFCYSAHVGSFGYMIGKDEIQKFIGDV